MIIIISAKGIIDATGCRIYIEEEEVYTDATGDLPIQTGRYNLMLTSLDKKPNVDFVISDSFDKKSATDVYAYILAAVKRHDKYVDIREVEKWKSTLGSDDE